MVRIAGVDLPSQKKILYSLTAVYGIGLHTAKKILEKAKVDSEIRTFELDDDSVGNIRSVLEDNYTVEGDLRKLKSLNINRLVSINCFRGKRHRQGLPLRGQRTRTNARTRRGSKKTMAGKKK
jgi:small subunit ribosomal protein S13|uniref:Small ribosomal subunit protein uS13c n=2 Tax=Heterosigma akashiwo TaxID=2829 RepID=B2XTD6_HETAK|nr:ribosomal protein S13 [Heterosigma akashiwo]ABV66034.1 30S ribosomal protein S13 [Heterosigma akashiwo]ABV70175.1 30S ribosomal protein S13 [Heterosigma akashiwo]BBA18240.1 30S ribosomal protein S1 [Heterosigma akashiwo]BBA18379.1 30S ribosomal protein S1 [Heterosigma akashiwo]BBA18518.1 30S ribosomal protein S1 [Heterosigma akashiwo]|mmetsp:Transcript_19614/g.29684  ORF Transcript_19614/g.29684 Transcript_19614/m.29684 type:complete len:123 (-) Transcript_19614:5905-6273(-)